MSLYLRAMNEETLSRFRSGLASGEFTTYQMSKLTGIPLMTLEGMKDPTWGKKFVPRLDTLHSVLKQMDKRSKRKKAPKGRRGVKQKL